MVLPSFMVEHHKIFDYSWHVCNILEVMQLNDQAAVIHCQSVNLCQYTCSIFFQAIAGAS